MTESTGKTGRGVKLEIGDGNSPTNFVPLANVKSIGFTGRDAEEIDFTHLDTEGGFRELRAGFKDPGTVNFEIQFDPTNATHQNLLTQFLSGDIIDWRINYAGAGWNYAEYGRGFVKNPGDTTINTSDPIGGSGTLRVTGQTAILPV